MEDVKHGVSFDLPSPAPRSSVVDTSKLSLPYNTDPPSTLNPPVPKVWLIFGATGQVGRSITKSALNHGDMVAAIGQSFQDDLKGVQKWYDDTEHYLGLLCDVRIRSSVLSVIDKTMKHFGAIDIIANCAGYGVIGACEDQDEHEIRNQFEVNFMGTLNMIQLSLPYFRKRQDGRYLIFSSTSGALGVPGLGPYCASKYAVEGLVESMLYEVDSFNIKVSLVEPGHLRRDDVDSMPPPPLLQQNSTASSATITATAGAKQRPGYVPLFGHFKIARPSSPYATKDAPAAHTQRTLQWMGSNQPTSVVKAAELVWQLGHCRYPPLRLLLGSFAIDSIRDRLKSIIEEIEDWKHLSFPPIEGFEEKEEGDDDDADEHDPGEGPGDDDDAMAGEPDADASRSEPVDADPDAREDTPIKLESAMDLDV
jgi:NAD(P)-dependent dehydrogenase (short-subunit alcohol dehydrogenase family)